MVQVKVEHVIVVLLGLFLLYHFMGSCGCNRVEGWIDMDYRDNQPYVVNKQYCGLDNSEQGAEAYFDKAIADALKTYNTTIDDIIRAQTSYNTAKTNYDTYKQAYEADVSSMEDATIEQVADAFRNAANTSAGMANAMVETMSQAAADLQAFNTTYTTATTALNQARENKVQAANECSKPNRLLQRYLPDIACEGTYGDGTVDKDAFTDLYVVDENTFSENVSLRQYDGGKNACKVLTADKDGDYPFEGLITTENKVFAGADYFRDKLPLISKVKPAPIQVASPLPTPYSKVEGPNYVRLRDPKVFTTA